MFDNSTDDPRKYRGWISWRRRIDPIQNRQMSGNLTGFDQNITYSVLAKYLGSRFQQPHSTPEEANRINPTLEQVFRCPSDNIQYRLAFAAGFNGGRGLYRYSYSMNIMFGNKGFDPGAAALGNNPLIGRPHRKMNQVKNPTEKIIYMDESERTVNNGEYNPTVVLADVDDNTKDYSAVAERHEMKSKRNSQNASGNVAFADGHAEFLSRKQAFERKHFDPDYGR
jgi:prepilin-type processing-associated H-X9-DG protein